MAAQLGLVTRASAASPPVSGPAPGSPVFLSFTASFNGAGNTQLQLNAMPGDASPLAYVWSLQNVHCGALADPNTRTDQNGYLHGPSATYPDGCPFAVESVTRVVVQVARANDLDASGMPRDGAPYFVYSQVARGHDSDQTADLGPAAMLQYYGVGAGTSSGTSAGAPPASATTGTSAGSGFPVAGVVVGVVVAGVGGVLLWYVVRRPRAEPVDLVHPFVEMPPTGEPPGPEVPQPQLPPAEKLPPGPGTAPGAPGGPEDTGTEGATSATGTAPDEDPEPDDGDSQPPPLIFGPRLIDLPLGEPPAPGDGGVEQPTLPPHEQFAPPPPPPTPPPPAQPPPAAAVTPPAQAAPPRARHCAPQVDDIFIDALNRVLSRLRTLFGTAPSMASGLLFLAQNGGELDFWVLNPQTTCPGPHCLSTMTLCGRCYPPHLLSDIMYGFVGGYFDLDSAVAAGGLAYQLEKWLADKVSGGKLVKQVVSPQHVTEAQPAYQVGVRLGKACREPQHEGRWHLTKDDVCAELNAMNAQSALLKLLLADPSQSADCPPATCVNTAADTDWSRKRWNTEMPLDVTQRWAVTGER